MAKGWNVPAMNQGTEKIQLTCAHLTKVESLKGALDKMTLMARTLRAEEEVYWSVYALIPALGSPEENLRLAALKGLSQAGSRAISGMIEAMNQTRSAALGFGLVWGLRRIGREDPITVGWALADMLRNQKDRAHGKVYLEATESLVCIPKDGKALLSGWRKVSGKRRSHRTASRANGFVRPASGTRPPDNDWSSGTESDNTAASPVSVFAVEVPA